ncbi:MAG: prephenate dehydrogenase [Maritimibacter sp.]
MQAFDMDRKPALGLIGFGAFARLLARHLTPFAQLSAYDSAPQVCAEMAGLGVVPAPLDRVAAADIVVIATPVAAIEAMTEAIVPHIRPGAVVLDVGSVKQRPARAMERYLPAHATLIATHPLFGPESAGDGLAGLKIALCPLRGARVAGLAMFLRRAFGLQVIVTTPEAHDRELAAVQGLTHLIAKALTAMELPDSRMTTKSFEHLMRATAMVAGDAPEVFATIERDNPFAAPLRTRFLKVAAELSDEPSYPALTAQSQ